MTINEAVKQANFRDEQQKMLINILYTNNWLINKIKKTLKSHNITHQQYNVLRILQGSHPSACSAGDIKRVMLDKTPDVTRLIDRLLQKDYVSRCRCSNNRRQIEICITKKGISLLQNIRPKMDEMMQFTQQISENDAMEVNQILDKLRSKFENEQITK
ncbi:MAG: MarR family winged helix-turn-helix transcriptional regulator [Chitinophagales bacterium]